MNHTLKFHKISNFDEEGGTIIYITCKIDNEKVNMVLDTGASRTCIDEQTYKKISQNKKNQVLQNNIQTAGIGPNSMLSKLVTIDKLRINRLCIENFNIIVTNLSNITAVLGKQIQIDGVLGNDILVNYNAVINYGKSTVKFSNNL